MNNIELSILGSSSFLNLLNELDFSKIINSNHHQNKERARIYNLMALLMKNY